MCCRLATSETFCRVPTGTSQPLPSAAAESRVSEVRRSTETVVELLQGKEACRGQRQRGVAGGGFETMARSRVSFTTALSRLRRASQARSSQLCVKRLYTLL